MDYLTALLICVLAAGIEGLCAGDKPVEKLTGLRQPAWAPSMPVWVAIGLAWYAACFIGLVRLLPLWPQDPVPVILLCALLLANGVGNLFLFRLERLDLGFFFLFPYALLLGAFLWVACPLDRLVCALFGLYALYLIFAAAWTWQLWVLNPVRRD